FRRGGPEVRCHRAPHLTRERRRWKYRARPDSLNGCKRVAGVASQTVIGGKRKTSCDVLKDLIETHVIGSRVPASQHKLSAVGEDTERPRSFFESIVESDSR